MYREREAEQFFGAAERMQKEIQAKNLAISTLEAKQKQIRKQRNTLDSSVKVYKQRYEKYKREVQTLRIANAQLKDDLADAKTQA